MTSLIRIPKSAGYGLGRGSERSIVKKAPMRTPTAVGKSAAKFKPMKPLTKKLLTQKRRTFSI